MTDKYRDSLVKDLYELEVNCTDCILDLTDACPRGAGRAVDDEVCESFLPRETYQVNKNDSWQLGYQQGRADAIEEFLEKLPFSFDGKISESTVHQIAEQLKENKNND